MNYTPVAPMQKNDGDNRPSAMRPLILALFLAVTFGALDGLKLQIGTASQWDGPVAYLVFAGFVIQSFLISWIVGTKSRQHWIWWALFAWSMIAINLQLHLVNINHTHFYQGEAHLATFVFAFLTAQLGLVVFLGINSAIPPWQFRYPVFAAVLLACCYPVWADFPASSKLWNQLLLVYLASSAVSCGILRWMRFELTITPDASQQRDHNPEPRGQFRISHLLIWTTIVAVLIGIGGAIDWLWILDGITQEFKTHVGRALLLTVGTVTIVWTVMGAGSPWWLRYPLMLILLSIVAAGFFAIDAYGFLSQQSKAGWFLSPSIGWVRGSNLKTEDYMQMMQVWGLWTFLNASFLTSLLLLFRIAGFRFSRAIPNQKSTK